MNIRTLLAGGRTLTWWLVLAWVAPPALAQAQAPQQAAAPAEPQAPAATVSATPAEVPAESAATPAESAVAPAEPAEAPAESAEAPAEPVEPVKPVEITTYGVTFEVIVVPSEKSARVTVRLGAESEVVEWIRFRNDPVRYSQMEGDGVEVKGDVVQWTPQGPGSTLKYTVHIDHLRDPRSYDARLARRWAIVRGEDLVPVIRVRAPRARSRSRMRLRLPEGWSAAVPYGVTASGEYLLDNPRSRFDRPRGWFVLGEIGVVRETLEGVDVAIAGPREHGLRRFDLLAMLTWTLPEVSRLFPDMPNKLLIVGAGDPMWRGGLSGPNSLFLHADRPLISDDGTSPVLHELMHVLLRAAAGPGGDWVVEGLAELYSRDILRRSGVLSEARHTKYMEDVRERAANGGSLRVASVSGDTLDRAVLTLLLLDTELREATEGAAGLDQVLALLAADRKSVTTNRFRAFAEQVAGTDLGSFFDTHVPMPAASN